MFKTVTVSIRLLKSAPLFKFVVKVLKLVLESRSERQCWHKREAITSNTERVIQYTIRVGPSDTRE